MRRFASVDTFFESSDWGFRMGRPVVNQQFLGALLQYGTFDAYHFFLPDMSSIDTWKQRIIHTLPDKSMQSRILLAPMGKLREALVQCDFHIFHQGDFTYFGPLLAGLRKDATLRPFPISGLTHSLDNLQSRFLQLTLSSWQSYDAIICSSQTAYTLVTKKIAEMQQLLYETFGKYIDVPIAKPIIPLGLDDKALATKHVVQTQARDALGLSHDKTIFLSVGRLSVRTKNDWSPILGLLGDMKRSGDLGNMHWVLAGGAKQDSIQNLQAIIAQESLHEHVTLMPNFTATIKPMLYAASDVCVALVDNYQETCGLSVLEAMGAGLPVIAADFDGYRDSVVHNESGFLIPTTTVAVLPDFLNHTLELLDKDLKRFYLAQTVAIDLARLHDAIMHMYNNHTLRKRMGDTGHAIAQRYHWRYIIKRYEDVWLGLHQQLVDNKHVACDIPAAILHGRGVDAYQHYTTRLLHADDVYTITPRGQRARLDANVLTRYEDIVITQQQLIEAVLLETLLRAPATVTHLRSMVVQCNLCHLVHDIDYHIIWLFKQGAIALQDHIV